MFTKILQFTSLTLISFYAFGLEVESLNQGSCYFHQDQMGDIKVASFNDSKSFQLNPTQWNDFLDGLGAHKADTLIHCSGHGARMVVNFESDKGRECVWAKVNGSDIEVLDRDLSNYNSGLCDGVVENRLIVSFKSNGLSDTENFTQIENNYAIEVNEVRELAKGVYEMSFESQSDDVFSIKSLLEKSKTLRYVDLVTRLRPVGDYKVIEELSK